MQFTSVGLDVSKATLQACLLIGDRSVFKEFSNDSKGYRSLVGWASRLSGEPEIRWCLESTGPYSLGIAIHLQDAGFHVSVVNPRRIKSFGIGIGCLQKTDKADSKVIALYGSIVRPRPWALADPAFRQLVQLMRRLEQVQRIRIAENNRLECKEHHGEVVLDSIEQSVLFFEKEEARLEAAALKLVQSDLRLKAFYDALVKEKKGVGSRTALRLLTELGDPKDYESAEQCAAHAGLYPILCESGLTNKRSRMANLGKLPSILHYPNLTAMRYDPGIVEYRKRLEAKGKSKSAIRGACKRKLLMQCYGILNRVDQEITPP